ncbi:MAG: iron-siderophore ABC transporter substrate-binding protein [Egibacteraceae bacterium]
MTLRPIALAIAVMLVATAGVSPAASAASAAEAAFPVTIEHKFGSTTITEEPQRVLSLGYSDQDPILALGVVPIAVRYWYGDESDAVFPWARDALGDDTSPEVLNMPEVNFERIAALQPDVIIATYAGITADEYDTLSQIAPTVAQSGEYIDYGMPWQEVTVAIGRALGRVERAEELVAEVEAQFAAARDEHPEFAGLTLAAVGGEFEGRYGFFASADPRARIFSSLGFQLPEEFDEIAGEQFYGDISAEQLELFDRDVVVFQQIQFLENGLAGLKADPFVQQLDAVREGRVIYVDQELDDALAFNSVLSLPFALEGLVPLLAAAADGDPAVVPS